MRFRFMKYTVTRIKNLIKLNKLVADADPFDKIHNAFLAVSCQSQEAKKENSLVSITCNLISLEGVDEIYTITENVLKVKGQKDKNIEESEFSKLKNIPIIVTQKDGKYGCGVCTDAVDHKFVFNFKNGKRQLGK